MEKDNYNEKLCLMWMNALINQGHSLEHSFEITAAWFNKKPSEVRALFWNDFYKQ